MIRLHVVLAILGFLSVGFAYLMAPPLIAAIFMHEMDSALAFTLCIVFSACIGYITRRLDPESDFDDLNRMEGIAVVVLAWLVIGLEGTIPYLYFGMSIPDAIFESFSGFTTTGATIISDFSKYNSSLYWYRSYTQWLGGMGIMVLFVAIMPHLAISGRQLFYAETSFESRDKLTPRIADTARSLWVWYVFLTILMIALLIFVGMSANDAVCNSFSTLAAGGFCPNPDSIAGYNNTKAEWIIIIFMFLAGANFMLQVKSIKNRNLEFFKNTELKAYTFVVVVISLLLAWILTVENCGGKTILDNIRLALFHNLSITTTTGSASVDYGTWPDSAKSLLVIFMFIGGCSGSAGGGIKVIRIIILFKYLAKNILKQIYPQAVLTIKLKKKVVSDQEVQPIVTFVIIYIITMIVFGITLSIIENNFSMGYMATITSLGNIGPAFWGVGPMGSFAELKTISKIICSILMWAGRLEVIALLMLLHPEVWRKARW